MSDVAEDAAPFPADRALRLGTRGSPMALAQAAHVASLLRELVPGARVETVPTTTEADRWMGDLSAVGGKGLFVKAVDDQLTAGRTDLVVHCLKDVPGDRPLPPGLVIAAVLSRSDVRDVLVVPEGSPVASLADLPAGSTVATSSVRRASQLRTLRPDLNVVPVRGAVGSRLAKLDAGAAASPSGSAGDGRRVHAMVVARAGLERLGLTGRARYAFPVHEMLPAVGAAVLALQCREDDAPVRRLLARLDDPVTRAETTAERAMLHVLRGHCNSPIAGHCLTEADGRLSLRGTVFASDGDAFVHAQLHSREAGEDPADLGMRVGVELLQQGARDLIDGARR